MSGIVSDPDGGPVVDGQSADHERLLVERARTGDRRAFAAIVRRYMERVYRAAWRFVRNEEEARDIAQDTFVRAWRSIERFEPGRPVYPWLCRIARNLSLNRIERRGRNETSLPDFDVLPASGGGPEEALLAGEASGRVRAALTELSEEHRTVIVLHHFRECSYAEIAAALSIPIGTVMSRLYHARRRLRSLLEREE